MARCNASARTTVSRHIRPPFMVDKREHSRRPVAARQRIDPASCRYTRLCCKSADSTCIPLDRNMPLEMNALHVPCVVPQPARWLGTAALQNNLHTSRSSMVRQLGEASALRERSLKEL